MSPPGTTPADPAATGTPLLLHSREALWRTLQAWRQEGQEWALVPTMGNLHAGHLSLVQRAQSLAPRVIVSIFVNPTQFGPNEDFQRYPRTLKADLAQLAALGVDAVFAPAAETVYPHGLNQTLILPAPAQLSETLCGLARPGHFDGVVTVVSRLFNLCQPRWAVFGEKDYQQLLVIQYMAHELGYPLEIVPSPTLRENNGLAMSSRNQYLSEAQRQQAAVIHAQLQNCVQQLCQSGTERSRTNFKQMEQSALAQIQRAGLVAEYFQIRRASDLAPPPDGESGALRILAAARLEQTRLIDNLACPAST